MKHSENERSEHLREKLEFHKRWLNERLHNDSNGFFDEDDSEKQNQSLYSRYRDNSEPHYKSRLDETNQENENSKYYQDNSISHLYHRSGEHDETTFLNKNSHSYLENNKRPKRWEALYNLNKKFIQMKEQAAKQAEKPDLDPECTFKPKIRSLNIHSNSKDTLSIHERNRLWKERKDAKLAMTREISRDKDLKGCTFRPTISSNKTNKSFQGISSYESKGIEKYLKRQVIARKVKEEKEMILENPLCRLPENVTKRDGKITIPKGPKFGDKLLGIPSLRKPLIPTNVSNYSSKQNLVLSKRAIIPLGERHDNIRKIHDFFDESSIRVQDVGFVDALTTLHLELHKFDIEYD